MAEIAIAIRESILFSISSELSYLIWWLRKNAIQNKFPNSLSNVGQIQALRYCQKIWASSLRKIITSSSTCFPEVGSAISHYIRFLREQGFSSGEYAIKAVVATVHPENLASWKIQERMSLHFVGNGTIRGFLPRKSIDTIFRMEPFLFLNCNASFTKGKKQIVDSFQLGGHR